MHTRYSIRHLQSVAAEMRPSANHCNLIQLICIIGETGEERLGLKMLLVGFR